MDVASALGGLMFIALIILPIVSAVICYFIAKQRNAQTSFWLLMGLVFSVFAIPFAFFAKPKK
jgi:cytochrome c biogenesis protein CcdA